MRAWRMALSPRDTGGVNAGEKMHRRAGVKMHQGAAE
jgi:hypothetical protein